MQLVQPPPRLARGEGREGAQRGLHAPRQRRRDDELRASDDLRGACRDVAAQVAFESKGLKPVFHLIGSRVETGCFQAMDELDSTCTAQPRALRTAALRTASGARQGSSRRDTGTSRARPRYETPVVLVGWLVGWLVVSECALGMLLCYMCACACMRCFLGFEERRE